LRAMPICRFQAGRILHWRRILRTAMIEGVDAAVHAAE
jgi:hypothetical protein